MFSGKYEPAYQPDVLQVLFLTPWACYTFRSKAENTLPRQRVYYSLPEDETKLVRILKKVVYDQ